MTAHNYVECNVAVLKNTYHFCSYIKWLHAHSLHIKCILQLYKTIPISYLEGELFQADVTCGDTSGKLMFKFNGSRILSNRGS